MAAPELWIWVTLAAAAFQTVRLMLQKVLTTATLSPGGATFARFIYALPLAALGMAAYLGASGQGWPVLAQGFWAFALLGAVTQILGTVCVLALFQARNFAVGVTFKNTETVQTVLVGWVVLGEGVSALGFAAIGLGVVGLLVLSGESGRLRLADLWQRAAALGVGSGLLFAFSSVSYRGATLAVESADALVRAGVTLALVVGMQTVIMAVWLAWREPGQIAAVWSARRVAVWIGLTSVAGSLGWFIAFALQNAAYVKALGQVELILSLFATVLFFKEKISAREMAGMALLLGSILLLIAVI